MTARFDPIYGPCFDAPGDADPPGLTFIFPASDLEHFDKRDRLAAAAIMATKDLRYWLALKTAEGVGNVGVRNLVAAFGTAEQVFRASPEALKRVPGIGDRTARNILEFRRWDQVDRELELADRHGVSIITAASGDYPRLLLHIYDYPPVLYVKGLLRPDDVCVAVVGSRAASAYGKFTTERLSRELAHRGVTVVSGLARGIDSSAHRGALAAKGRTVAVLGCGADVVYPPENRKLCDSIAERGAVVTECPFETPPNAPNFPARNRIISGMSLGVVVVEAGEKSGSLITARTAMDQGREVFAVPGSIDAPGSRGTHGLIREGAKLIESVDDILEEILPQFEIRKEPAERASSSPRAPGPGRGAETAALLEALSDRPLDLDSIIDRTGFRAQDVMRMLTALELEGLVVQHPGKQFTRRMGDG